MTNGRCSARYMTLETMAPLSEDPIVGLPPWPSSTDPAHAGNRRDQTAPATRHEQRKVVAKVEAEPAAA